MSRQDQLNLYIERILHRLRLGTAALGASIVAAIALLTTVVLAFLLNVYAFPEHAIAPARIVLFGAVVAAIAFGLALPWLRLTRKSSIRRVEAAFPELEQRLVTFAERERANDPFIELLAADTLTYADDAPPSHLVPRQRLLVLLGIFIACIGALVWLVAASPGHLGYGASLLWSGPKHNAAPLYQIKVTPGDVAVRRNSDQLVTAQIIGLDPAKVNLYVRYQNTSKWEPIAMQSQEGSPGYHFLFAGLSESVEYYVEAGPLHTKHFNVRVVDLPAVKAIHVTYHYPKWTGLQTVSEEQGGDLRALEGTDAELNVVMDRPLKDGLLVLDNSHPLQLTGGEDNRYHATIHLDHDGAYHVAAMDKGQQVRLSEDYFVSVSKINPPSIAIDRPTADYRASPIEEITIGVKSGADFGLRHVALHYSVNGNPEQTVDLLKQSGVKTASNTTTLHLEDFKMSPGDVISLYATAKDAHSESRTDIGFIQVDPFEREFSQSQQSGGGGGGGGGGQGNQTDISRREKELIAATWKQQNDKKATAQQNVDMGKTLSEAQEKLREQALALAGRMQSRDLSSANEEFNSFEHDMETAAKAMSPSADKLKIQAWHDALPQEQKALQALLRAEATFRKIQVAFGQRGGGGSGGGGAGRDLASLFDLELDTEKNQYETAQTGSPAEEKAKKVDEALEKLDALAQRQEELAQQQGTKQQTFQQRWEQEMLRREAEQLQRDMEQMQKQQSGQQNANGASSQSGQGQSGQSKSGPPQQAGGGSQQGADSKDGNTDPRVQQALSHLRAANDAMRRASAQPQSGQSGQQATEQARRSAEQLREATNLLGGAQKQQAGSKLDSLAREADRLAKEESAQAAKIHSLANPQNTGDVTTMSQMISARAKRDQLAKDRQQLSEDLSHLEKGLRGTARELAPTQSGTSSKLRDALTEMDQSDLGNRVQRTADWLRRGINPESNGTEEAVASGLKKLSDQIAQAKQSMGSNSDQEGRRANGHDTQEAALGRIDKLRSAIQSLSSSKDRRNESLARGGQQQGQLGQQGSGQQAGNGQAQGQAGSGSQQGGSQSGAIGKDHGNSFQRGGGQGDTVYNNLDTGNAGFDPHARHANAPAHIQNPADTERTIRQGLDQLNQLRSFAKDDPAAERQIQDLIREMQKLDPRRFPGNPEMVEQLHAQVLNDVDKLELQLGGNTSFVPSGQVRVSKTAVVPAAYQDAVAEYYRRLSGSH